MAISDLKKLPAEKKEQLIPSLLQHLRHEDGRVVNRAVEALVLIGDQTLPQLVMALKDPDAYVRLTACAALGSFGTASKPALPDLIQTLNDPHPLVREEAVAVIGEIGPAAEEAVPALLQLTRNENTDIKEAAEEALSKIKKPAPSVAPKKKERRS